MSEQNALTDPRSVLLRSPMSRLQITAVSLCIGLNALDGFDVLSISFAAPGIASEWAIDRAALGVILSAELIGMGIGSALLGGIADQVGRRPTILTCLVIMAMGMFLASTANGMPTMLAYRFGTGLGIGGMLASINAMSAEFANARRRNLCVTLMAAGYPAGAIAGGTIASMLLVSLDWRYVFVFGGVLTAAFLPLVWFLMPESIEFLQQKRSKGALQRINLTLRRMGHDTLDDLSMPADRPARQGLRSLFSPALARTTVLLTLAYFAHIMTFYFFIKWIPKLVVDLGFSASTAGSVLVWTNVGGVSGAVLLGLLTQRMNLRWLVIGAMLLAAAMVVVFGLTGADLGILSVVSAGVGFFANAAIVGLYAMFAQSFPTQLRATGTGLIIGVGRGGAALAPIVAGLLFVTGASLPVVSTAMGCGALFGAVMLLLLRYREEG